MSGGMIAAGVMPIWASSARRRGLDDASTSVGPVPVCEAGLSSANWIDSFPSLEAERDAALAEVIGRHLDIDPVAGQDPDAILPHLAARVRQDGVFIVQFHAKHR